MLFLVGVGQRNLLEPISMILRKRNENAGFTLLEILVVMAIVGMMVAMAAFSISSSQPNYRLAEAINSVSLTLQTARARAIRTGRVHKVCLFRGDDDTGANPDDQGRAILLTCNPSVSVNNCTLNVACEYSSGGSGLSTNVCTTDVTCQAGGCNWCTVNSAYTDPDIDIQFDDPVRGIRDASIEAFMGSTGAEITTTPPDWIEVAFDSLGLIDVNNTCFGINAGAATCGSNLVTVGGVRVEQVLSTNAVGEPERIRSRGIRWVVGGSTRLFHCQDVLGTQTCNCPDPKNCP